MVPLYFTLGGHGQKGPLWIRPCISDDAFETLEDLLGHHVCREEAYVDFLKYKFIWEENVLLRLQ